MDFTVKDTKNKNGKTENNDIQSAEIVRESLCLNGDLGLILVFTDGKYLFNCVWE